ncbi:GLPGLI family protein [Chryseobacterium sp. JJR-5R]|uniref:GLPGLI family protein n=1 Tax=Chryseobacterium sp. JJR-5R TaxID=3093923 RepID=UPI002A74D4C3|nr:GLPGLI family protein [Chryseobacterium sp. JJR-5R]WPO82810.1 GLPGLI family protein [Chryseobacterium sp. JJR-5R]
MKKNFSIILIILYIFSNAQARRFFYEFSYKPSKDSSHAEKEMTILDVTKQKSIYRDYLSVSQDSMIESNIEKMKATGVQIDLAKLLKTPKFMYKVQKSYPSYETSYTDLILSDFITYPETGKINWKISDEKGVSTFEKYKIQKATATAWGRNWTAWFTPDIPIQDGPYKFYGLPGLIVKIEDQDQNFSWQLAGIKNLEKYNELSLNERLKNKQALVVNKNKFTQMFAEFKTSPLAQIRSKYTSEQLNQADEGGKTLGQKLRDQEETIKKMIGANNQSIELVQ